MTSCLLETIEPTYDLSLNLNVTGRCCCGVDFCSNHAASPIAFILEAANNQNPDSAIFNKHTMELVAYV